jgi:hypothetical protein
MALEGTIKDFGLPDIFQLIGLQRKTGHLTLKNDKEQLVVAFENGMVVNADSAQKRTEDRLGNVLVKQGKLTKETLEEALNVQKATLQRLGHILVSQNYITSKDLQEALHTQVSQLVFKVFRWRDGEYHFAPADSVDYDRENFQPMSADFILMEGIRMVDEWPIIEKKIPSMDMVFRPVVDAANIEVAGGDDDVFSSSSKSASSKIRLSRDEERIFRRVDGQRTVQGIIDVTGIGEFEVCRILFDLLNRNLISPAGKGAVERETTAVASAASAGPGYAVAAVAIGLALLSTVVHLRSPLAVPGLPAFLDKPYHMLQDDLSQARLERLDHAVLAFSLATGALPATLEELVQRKLVDRTYLTDPWARPYHYEITGNGYLLNATDDAGKAIAGTAVERTVARER